MVCVTSLHPPCLAGELPRQKPRAETLGKLASNQRCLQDIETGDASFIRAQEIIPRGLQDRPSPEGKMHW